MTQAQGLDSVQQARVSNNGSGAGRVPRPRCRYRHLAPGSLRVSVVAVRKLSSPSSKAVTEPDSAGVGAGLATHHEWPSLRRRCRTALASLLRKLQVHGSHVWPDCESSSMVPSLHLPRPPSLLLSKEQEDNTTFSSRPCGYYCQEIDFPPLRTSRSHLDASRRIHRRLCFPGVPESQVRVCACTRLRTRRVRLLLVAADGLASFRSRSVGRTIRAL